MRRIYLLSLSLLSALLMITSCDEDEEDSHTTYTSDAMLTWSGDYAVDGCGFILTIGDEQYKPTNEQDISSYYKTDTPTPVEALIIDYRKKGQIGCGLSVTKMNLVKVVSLRKL
ncbi:hypothetical protein [Pontibacter akesuensis]|uniref:Lipoprotein n=1 Tax=Pontibacter akesuensis TaxID=388950 RepID=A0A1I7GJU6_9BACT|nr:hypothetical protein [Pontibacter akesuensis]SFU48601.1 hypothetical protein SAMN04487941_1067 [Pontibacter akesuensis]